MSAGVLLQLEVCGQSVSQYSSLSGEAPAKVEIPASCNTA